MNTIDDWLTNPDETATAPRQEPLRARYMSDAALLQTLVSHELRMQTFTRMNDPREVRKWRTEVAAGTDTDMPIVDIQDRVESVLQRSARVMSFTGERPAATEAERPHLLHRCWARSGMWNRYAQDHRGACLIVDVSEVSYQLGQLGLLGERRFRADGKVDYRDTPMELTLPGTFTSHDAVDERLAAYLDELQGSPDDGRTGYTNTVLEHLYFEKNRSWSDETEWRIVAVDLRPRPETIDQPYYVPAGDSIKAIIFGEEYARPEITAAAVIRFHEQARADPPAMFRCRWQRGVPELEPVHAQPGSEYDLYWFGQSTVAADESDSDLLLIDERADVAANDMTTQPQMNEDGREARAKP